MSLGYTIKNNVMLVFHFLKKSKQVVAMKERKNTIPLILGTLLLFLSAFLLLLFFYNKVLKPDLASEESKTIYVRVIVPDEEEQEFTIVTDAETLREALDEKKLIGGEESTYGFLITEVNGRKADSSRQEWWCLTKDGEFSEFGVDMIKIQDQDRYELTLMEGY